MEVLHRQEAAESGSGPRQQGSRTQGRVLRCDIPFLPRLTPEKHGIGIGLILWPASHHTRHPVTTQTCLATRQLSV